MSRAIAFVCAMVIATVVAPALMQVQDVSAQSRSSGPEEVYFPDTGQYLEGEFLEFWWEYGGMPVFGFPVSPEFEQDGMTVQYFERAVLEIHPDNPDEWRILLRRLGAEAIDDDLEEHPAFEDQTEAESGLYFPETRKNLQFGFRDHWEKNGGVRIFGFPMSGEFEQDGFTVQYFERAIFEYHPDNPEEWRILQPLIGARAAHADDVDMEPQPHDDDVPIYHPNLWAPPDNRVVYLTFDDGPHATWTPQILDTLAEFDASATFFVLGQYADEHPGIVQRAASEGHTIANHTYNHASMAGMSFAQFQWQIQATENAVGGNMAPCLRPPYGAMDGNTRSFASMLGYDVVMWDVDPQDWTQPGAGVIADRVVHNSGPGSIVLLHDGPGNRAQTAQALRSILQRLSDQGYRFEAMCQ